MKPVIGLIPLYDENLDSYWMLPGYMQILEEYGALPIMLPLTSDTDELRQCFDMCDGLLLTGGHDVAPSVYGEEPSPECGIACDIRDEMEGYLVKLAVEEDKPVFGICRGVQFMNAALGGTLYQDLSTEHPSDVDHHMTFPYDRPVHRVEVLGNTSLADILGKGYHNVNSYHHQAIKDLAPGVRALAVTDDGLVEAIDIPDKKFFLGVQWHPEFSYKVDEDACKLVQAFIDACKQCI